MNPPADNNGQTARAAQRRDPYAAFRVRDFRLLLGGSLLANVGRNMQSVAVGWELYERSNSAMALGWVGLIQALPVILCSMPAGHLADRRDRKRIVAMTQVLLALSSLGLACVSALHGPIALMYACLLFGAFAQAFNGAASSALLPQTVPAAIFGNAVAWKSSSFHIASVAGPALGGFAIAALRGTRYVYLADAAFCLIYAIFATRLQSRSDIRPAEDLSLKTLAAGFRYVWNTKIILAAISLDLFAVLFGGATMLMPIYARDILHVGPTGLGWLRSAPALGAFLMGLFIAHYPPRKHVGRQLLWAVAGFGVATIVFGVSHWYALSLAMLFLTGALDNISVFVRHNLVQLKTPDAMRGRVSAVNNVFISSSNELGAFESGLVAALFGPVFSVVSGGLGTLLVVWLTARIWPEIGRLDRVDSPV